MASAWTRLTEDLPYSYYVTNDDVLALETGGEFACEAAIAIVDRIMEDRERPRD